MVCNNCNKNQATHAVKNGDEELYVCEECYESLGYAAEYVGDADFFVSFLPPEPKEEIRCPVCGATLADYSRTGLVGCANCYTAFREELMPVISRIHGKTQHVGKRPLGDDVLFELLAEQKELRAELERAVKEKRMKDAERINRQIRDISRVIAEGGFGGEDDQ